MNRCEQSELLEPGRPWTEVGPGRDGTRAGLECITEFNNSSSHSICRGLAWADGLRSEQTATEVPIYLTLLRTGLLCVRLSGYIAGYVPSWAVDQ